MPAVIMINYGSGKPSQCLVCLGQKNKIINKQAQIYNFILYTLYSILYTLYIIHYTLYFITDEMARFAKYAFIIGCIFIFIKIKIKINRRYHIASIHQTQNMSQANQYLCQQYFYGEELEEINKVYIKTQSYGNIFSYAVGKPGQPLIIIVHGSGPKNSADQYLYLLHEYLVRVSYIEKYYIIAIDCPGYGRSKGSKEAIKTFPLQLFREILKQLQYDFYYAMLGHSQGGAAIFNAVYEDRTLAQYLLMDRPVCGNIKRFNNFPLPTLLVYDIQDDGHPIWQGKLLFKQLLASQLHTYRASQNAYYVPDNLWNFILNLFNKYKQGKKANKRMEKYQNRVNHKSNDAKYKSKQRNDNKIKNKNLTRHADSLTKFQLRKRQDYQTKKQGIQLKKIQQVDKSQLHSIASMSVEMQELENLPTWMNQPKIQQTEQEIKFQIQMKKKHQQLFLIKQKAKYVNDKEKENEIIDQKQQNKDKFRQVKIQPSKQQAKKLLQEQQMQNKCSICHEQYFHPIQTNCKHIFCKKCLGQSLLIDERCPLCRTKVSKKEEKGQLHNEIVEKLSGKQKQRRQRQLLSFQNMLKSIIYIEIGNNSRVLQTKKSLFSKTKTKYVWEVFVREPRNFKLEEVHFNINMGERDAKPVKVSHAPFVFQSRGTFSFSCQITIKPKNKDYAPITTIYRIDVNPGLHTKVVALKKKKN